jgi:peptidoglycan/xylan/chitin deacetylase (PgdA/CDA1 family)
LLVVATPGGLRAEREYAVDMVMRLHVRVPYRHEFHDAHQVVIRHAELPGEITLPDVFFPLAERHWLAPQSLPQEPSARPFGDDAFGTAFFFLTRYEEATKPDRDNHDRFPYEASLAKAAGLADVPVVNEQAEELWAKIRALWPGVEREPRKRRTFVSHDIDTLSIVDKFHPKTFIRTLGGDVLVRKSSALAASRAIRTLLSPLGLAPYRTDPFNTFDYLMDVSERHGLRSGFFFICGRTHPTNDADYDTNDPRLVPILRRIAERGHEIGLHPSYNTFRSPNAVLEEKDTLRELARQAGADLQAIGGRQHYLRWETTGTWDAWDQAGLAYDSTVGFAQQPGFRAGTCYEYPVFSLKQRRRLDLLERPLVVMETTLFSKNYLGLSPSDCIERTRELAQVVDRYDGDMTLLAHNDFVWNGDRKRLYEAMVVAATGG